MAQNKDVSYFTFTDVEKRVKKRLNEIEEDNKDSNSSFKKHLFVTQSYYKNVMDSLEALKKKDKAHDRKIEKIQKDVKSIYLLSAMTLKLMNEDVLIKLNDIRNITKK